MQILKTLNLAKSFPEGGRKNIPPFGVLLVPRAPPPPPKHVLDSQPNISCILVPNR